MSKRVDYVFPTDYESILKRIDEIDPIKYARSRNFIDGDVTYLSPYISRGVISVNMIKDIIFKRGYKKYEIEKIYTGTRLERILAAHLAKQRRRNSIRFKTNSA